MIYNIFNIYAIFIIVICYITNFQACGKFNHTGSYSSYNCRMSLLPGISIGVWACVNSPGDQRGILSAKLMNQFALDLLLGKQVYLWCYFILCYSLALCAIEPQ